MKLSEIILGLAKIPFDFIMGLLAFLVAYQLRSNPNFIPGIQLPPDLEQFPAINKYFWFSASMILILIIIFALNKEYTFKRIIPLGEQTMRIIAISTVWFMVIIAYFFIIREFPFSRLALIYSWLLAIIFIFSDRLILKLIERVLLKYNIGKRRIVFIGDNEITQKIYEQLSRNPRYKIVGIINDKQNTNLRYLGTIDQLAKIIKSKRIAEIIQTKEDLSKLVASEILDFCRENHLEYSFVPDLISIHKTNIDIQTMSGIPIIKLKPTPLDGWGRVIKRLFDITGALFGLIMLSPVFLIISIAIKIDSKGNIFFKYLDDGSRVKRVGQYGELFAFYKFRTMHPNTHNLRYTKLADKDTRQGSPLVKIKNDPRVTRVGKFLRSTSLDELPQLINVLKGEMSLVGPRPHLPEEVAKYDQQHKFVLTIKPGISGQSQISGRSDLEFEEEIQLDTYYIENWSLWTDIKILFRTLGVVFKKHEE